MSWSEATLKIVEVACWTVVIVALVAGFLISIRRK